MPQRLSKRLAGFTATELLLALAVHAADFQAGFAASGSVKALALEDRRGSRAVLVNTAFPAPLALADRIAAEVIQAYGLERSSLLIRSVAAGEPAPRDAVIAIGAALGNLKDARIDFGQGLLQVSTAGECHAVDDNAFLAGCGLALTRVRGSIRSAYRLVDLTHGLQTREDTPPSCAVQAIALGDQVVILAAPENFLHAAPGRILAAFPPVPDDPRVSASIAEVLSRIKK